MKTLIIYITNPIETESDIKYAVLDGDCVDLYHDKWINTTDLSAVDEQRLLELDTVLTTMRPTLDGQYKIAICGFIQ